MGHTPDFVGDLDTNNNIPSVATLRRIENYLVLGEDGKSVFFRNLYTGTNVPRRVMVIFIRHFFCGNCQEYIRSLTDSISPSSLLQLKTPSTIVIIGHGAPSLIPMYREATKCPFPIYADPSKKLYNELGMIRTLNIGPRPEYQRRQLFSMIATSVIQSLKSIKSGNILQGGDLYQVGGEFMFEPVEMATPIGSVFDETKELGAEEKSTGDLGGEEKHITWCHRMRNTRDHAEIPELREVLGLDGEGSTVKWSKPLRGRKGTGLNGHTRALSSMSGKLEGGPRSHI